jgi:hypothetical protein
MTLTDAERRFLSVLAGAPEPVSTRELMSRLGISHDARIGERGRLLEAVGLVTRYHRVSDRRKPAVCYAITSKGRGTLAASKPHAGEGACRYG